MVEKNARSHRLACLRLTLVLLAVWVAVSFLAAILFRDQLDAFSNIGTAPLGFWMAQQGSIVCFVIILIVYAARMRQLDDQHGYNE